MATDAASAPGLSFPRDTFARLTPGPFLHAHLKRPDAVRPNGRLPTEFRTPIVNTGSLTHTNGSAVVRSGDTAVVCGVRAELLMADNVAHPPDDHVPHEDLAERLGLFVPNVELNTGCSPAHMPGNPPSAQAQSLSYRILSLLHDSHIVNVSDLTIKYQEPAANDDVPTDDPKVVTKAYWVLYLDIICIAFDGNILDTAWIAVLAALRDTVLPEASWDPDPALVLCSPTDSLKLQLNGLPIASTFAVFSSVSSLEEGRNAQSWILADPDSFEEDVSHESLTVCVVAEGPRVDVLRIQHGGGCYIGEDAMDTCMGLVAERYRTLKESLLKL